MTDRRFPKIPLAVLLLFTVLGSTLAFSPPPVFASDPPECGSVITTSTTLSANIGPCSGSGLVIGANHITLNCAGHTITGTSANTHAGIYLNGRTGVRVEDCNVGKFRYGFALYRSSGNTLNGNTAHNNGNDGFYLYSSSRNTLTKDTAKSNGNDGFYLIFSSSITYTGNTANSNAKYDYYERC